MFMSRSMPIARRADWSYRFMLSVWITLVVLMTVRTCIWPRRNSVYPIFADAAECWMRGADLYDEHFWLLGIDQYRYSPLVTAFFVPFALLPETLAGILWRFVNVALFFSGVVAFVRVIFPGRDRIGWSGAGCIGMLLIPLSLPSMNNDQANPLVIGSLLLAVVAAYRERWNWAAVALAVPILFKVYPFAIALLLLLVYPRQLGWRLAVALAVGLVLPFALQDPTYVSSQYAQWFNKLLHEDRSERIFTEAYRDCWLLMRWAHVPFPRSAYFPLQLAVATLVGGITLVGRLRRWPERTLLVHALNLGCCWMMLFGPATENCTYILVAPTFALATWEAFALGRPLWTRGVLAAIVCIFVSSAVITALPEGRNWAYPLNPIATLLLFGERLASLAVVRRSEPAQGSVRTEPAKAA